MTQDPARMAEWLENAWLERYLARDLSDEETQWFEIYAMEKPWLIAAIDADNDLRDGIVLSEAESTHGSRPHGRSGRPPWLPVALAATLALGVAVGALYPDKQAMFTTSPTQVRFDAFRSDATLQRTYKGAENAPVLVEVGLPKGSTDVRASHSSGTSIALQRDQDGFASFILLRPELVSDQMVTISYMVSGQQQSRTIDLSSVIEENSRD